ncbi:UNKNOWN [Stylonychia lemnae]|uniref:Uncharacterized protein n=1 Tax=Stylonychia lemnae TaxID=5949 RepID=A0A078BBF0_STYLE|nr:UNKNOWN [Stylonychia lemnae]|eukprot:CDW90592.1 UNKNOWN [Stylonychia lemnae]
MIPLIYPPINNIQTDRFSNEGSPRAVGKKLLKLKLNLNSLQKIYNSNMQAYQTHSINLNKQLRKSIDDKRYARISHSNNKNYPMRAILKSYSHSKKPPLNIREPSSNITSPKWNTISNNEIFRTLQNQNIPQYRQNLLNSSSSPLIQQTITNIQSPESIEKPKFNFIYRKTTLNSAQQQRILEQIKLKEQKSIDKIQLNQLAQAQVNNSPVVTHKYIPKIIKVPKMQSIQQLISEQEYIVPYDKPKKGSKQIKLEGTTLLIQQIMNKEKGNVIK